MKLCKHCKTRNAVKGFKNCTKCQKWDREYYHSRKSDIKFKLARQARDIRRKYGISPDEYDSRLQSQNNICALCGEPFDRGPQSKRDGRIGAKLIPSLDHDHVTKKLRKFIHKRCNTLIGIANDNVTLLRKAADYLEAHR